MQNEATQSIHQKGRGEADRAGSEQTIQQWSDSELYQRCKQYGLLARQSMRKFAGLLPEVHRRRLYRRRGCASIYEFAAKLAGMSEESVDRVLRLSKNLEDKPTLKEQFESGSQSWSKIEKVVSIATPQTEKMWAEKVATIPQQVLDLCVREVRQKNRLENVACDEIQPEIRERFSFEVDEVTALRFRQIKQQLEKQKGETMSFGEVLKALLKKEWGVPKTSNVQTCPECTEKRAHEAELAEEVSETMPAAVKRVVLARQEDRCAYLGCTRPPEIFHHTRRFALRRSHDPNFIVALCKAHERLAHCGLIGNEERPTTEWHLRELPDEMNPKFTIDQKVAVYRRE